MYNLGGKMKKVLKKFITTFILSLFIITGLIQLSSTEYGKKVSFSDKKPLVILDFNDKKLINCFGGKLDTFDFDPEDKNAYCRIGVQRDEDHNKTGYYMKISYSVESDKPAFNGLWTKLNKADLTKFEAISFKIKGDQERGFSDVFKIELKDQKHNLNVIIDGITDEWSNIIVQFDEFDGDLESIDFSNMIEFTIVFEDWRLKTKKGRYYIDDIAFISKKGESVLFKEVFNRVNY